MYQLLTEPGEKSTIFTIFGSYADQRHSWLILQVNASDVLGGEPASLSNGRRLRLASRGQLGLTPVLVSGVPCSEADYKRWSPSDERGGDCLLGREVAFKRRAPHATCFNGEEFDRPVTVSNCSCTRQDYEWLAWAGEGAGLGARRSPLCVLVSSDYGFKLSEDLSLQVCVPDPEFTGDLFAPPAPCPAGSAYRRSKG